MDDKMNLSDKYSESRWIGEQDVDSEIMQEGQKEKHRKYFAQRNKK